MRAWATVLHKCSGAVGRLIVNAVNEDENKRKGGGGKIQGACPNPLPHIIPSDHPHPGLEDHGAPRKCNVG